MTNMRHEHNYSEGIFIVRFDRYLIVGESSRLIAFYSGGTHLTSFTASLGKFIFGSANLSFDRPKQNHEGARRFRCY